MMIDNDLERATEPACLNSRAGSVLSAAERAFIAERLRLALDEVEAGAGDLRSVREAVRFQRDAIRASHRRLARLGGEA